MRTRNNSIARLSVPVWAEELHQEDQRIVDRRFGGEFDHGDLYTSDPVGRPGWYFDRKTRKCWVENAHGLLLKDSPAHWLHRFQREHEPRLTDAEMEAVRILQRAHLATPRQLLLVQIEDERRYLRSLYSGTRLRRARYTLQQKKAS